MNLAEKLSDILNHRQTKNILSIIETCQQTTKILAKRACLSFPTHVIYLTQGRMDQILLLIQLVS